LLPGALVISLDFELFWGMRDIIDREDPYTRNILNARQVIPRILDLFKEYDIAATWAIVGFLFAENNAEIELYSPAIRPQYFKTSLNPYYEKIGKTETEDPLHYAPQLILQISQSARQEIASHTFSHYYCLEQGTTRESFAADLDSALAIARKYGISIKSIVLPRNQYNPCYDDILLDRGIVAFRGTEKHSMYQVRKGFSAPHKRLYRLMDSYFNFSGQHLLSWSEIIENSGLCNISGSRFFRPYSKLLTFLDTCKVQRIMEAMEQAAKLNKIFHLYWHPHNFGSYSEKNVM